VMIRAIPLPPACNCNGLKTLATVFDILDIAMGIVSEGRGRRPSETIEYLPAENRAAVVLWPHR
jgi:hypothetical protein